MISLNLIYVFKFNYDAKQLWFIIHRRFANKSELGAPINDCF